MRRRKRRARKAASSTSSASPPQIPVCGYLLRANDLSLLAQGVVDLDDGWGVLYQALLPDFESCHLTTLYFYGRPGTKPIPPSGFDI
jgi:hypothetical protein